MLLLVVLLLLLLLRLLLTPRSPELPAGVHVATSLDGALSLCAGAALPMVEHAFVIGGASLYAEVRAAADAANGGAAAAGAAAAGAAAADPSLSRASSTRNARRST